jgi:peptide deformylase
MSRPEILKIDHPLLRQGVSNMPREAFGTSAFDELIATMFDVVRQAPGVGLAAPKIGVPWRRGRRHGSANVAFDAEGSGRSVCACLYEPDVVANPISRATSNERATFP